MGKQTNLILFDFSRAFDKVAHEKTPPKTPPLCYQRRHSLMDTVIFGQSKTGTCNLWDKLR